MKTEFYTDKTNTFKGQDFVKIYGQDWKPLDECSENEIKTLHTLLCVDNSCRELIKHHISHGCTSIIEQVRACARKFFGKLTPEPDIDDNGKLHFETV